MPKPGRPSIVHKVRARLCRFIQIGSRARLMSGSCHSLEMARIVLGSTDPDPAYVESVARAVRDAGHEVVLAGVTDLPGVAAAVVQEDAALVVRVGGSAQELVAALAARGVEDVPVTAVGPADGEGAVRWITAYDG